MVEGRLRGQIVEFIRSAQDLAFHNYRETVTLSKDDPKSPSIADNPTHSNVLQNNEQHSVGVLEMFYPAPPPQTNTESLLTHASKSSNPEVNTFSDSGYVSNPSALSSSQMSLLDSGQDNSTQVYAYWTPPPNNPWPGPNIGAAIPKAPENHLPTNCALSKPLYDKDTASGYGTTFNATSLSAESSESQPHSQSPLPVWNETEGYIEYSLLNGLSTSDSFNAALGA